ncbi:MAG: hypothetical protein VX519_02445 [Myxococcota bacterium]|nr:hypothetical protein [Myxococcota bacterium]
MSRKGRIRVSTVVLIALVAYGGLFVRDNWPVVWTQVQVDEAIKVSLLDWRDKSEGKARTRLLHELKEHDVPKSILDLSDVCTIGSCCMREVEAGFREIECDWEDYLWFPFTEKSVRLTFWVGQYLDPDDHLRDL